MCRTGTVMAGGGRRACARAQPTRSPWQRRQPTKFMFIHANPVSNWVLGVSLLAFGTYLVQPVSVGYHAHEVLKHIGEFRKWRWTTCHICDVAEMVSPCLRSSVELHDLSSKGESRVFISMRHRCCHGLKKPCYIFKVSDMLRGCYKRALVTCAA